MVAFLELLAASIVSGGANFFVFLALFLLFTIGTFASGEIRRSTRRELKVVRAGLRSIQWRVTGLTACVGLGVLVLTAGMFFLLPRTARAAFQHLVPERYHLPGFSNGVEPGRDRRDKDEQHGGDEGPQPSRESPCECEMARNRAGEVRWPAGGTTRCLPREQTIRVDKPQFQLIPDQERPQGDRVGYEVRVSGHRLRRSVFRGQTRVPHHQLAFYKEVVDGQLPLPYGFN